ncbi:signal peptidase II [Anaerotignum lactatifermentans]|uniref:Lipoprotein signal peptidase n=1 Tax=Anaerotignum lactatifermentans TaxID=160404 RepID=A0ABS2G7Q2_9FIRM|nr:signal peptidase II [Anaerotignum lactatifermentans]MBM6828244.1 signal peptidase II [Anaerotignum lactatifermentans]MBM6876593.1 signal peptidase II [Anaerotignum lactatifermentans]MBM6949827.1 signal peptidase II [Anaerotignum lactatifermentans]
MKEAGMVAGILGLDAVTKYLAAKKLPLGGRKEIVKNRFYLRHIKNAGMAYNLGEEHPKGVLAATGAMISYGFWKLFRLKREKDPAALWMAVLLGGALGNFLERLCFGRVTDFLYVKIKKAPIFNIADVAIALGALGILAVSGVKKDKSS